MKRVIMLCAITVCIATAMSRGVAGHYGLHSDKGVCTKQALSLCGCYDKHAECDVEAVEQFLLGDWYQVDKIDRAKERPRAVIISVRVKNDEMDASADKKSRGKIIKFRTRDIQVGGGSLLAKVEQVRVTQHRSDSCVFNLRYKVKSIGKVTGEEHVYESKRVLGNSLSDHFHEKRWESGKDDVPGYCSKR